MMCVYPLWTVNQNTLTLSLSVRGAELEVRERARGVQPFIGSGPGDGTFQGTGGKNKI